MNYLYDLFKKIFKRKRKINLPHIIVPKKRSRQLSYYHLNKELIKQKHKEKVIEMKLNGTYDEYKDKNNKYHRTYYANHRPLLQSKARNFYWNNRELCLQRTKHSNLKNPEKKKIRDRLFYIEHKTEMIDYIIQWQKDNPEKVKEYNQRHYEKYKTPKDI